MLMLRLHNKAIHLQCFKEKGCHLFNSKRNTLSLCTNKKFLVPKLKAHSQTCTYKHILTFQGKSHYNLYQLQSFTYPKRQASCNCHRIPQCLRLIQFFSFLQGKVHCHIFQCHRFLKHQIPTHYGSLMQPFTKERVRTESGGLGSCSERTLRGLN